MSRMYRLYLEEDTVLWFKEDGKIFFWEADSFRPNIKGVFRGKEKKNAEVSFKKEYISLIGDVFVPHKIIIEDGKKVFFNAR